VEQRHPQPAIRDLGERSIEGRNVASEQIGWDEVRPRCAGSPYATAFLVLGEELGIAPAAAPR
jgi:hypothetical protein